MIGYSTPLAYATDIATYNPNGAVWTPVMTGGGPPALIAQAA